MNPSTNTSASLPARRPQPVRGSAVTRTSASADSSRPAMKSRLKTALTVFRVGLGLEVFQKRVMQIPAKLCEESSTQADGLCIGCLGQREEVMRENANMQDFFVQSCRS